MSEEKIDLRQAAQQALNYIVATNSSSRFLLVPKSNLNKTIDALRAALAEPEQEPVAWAFRYDDGSWHDPSLTKHSRGMLPLYSCTTPPQRKPLTDEEIINIGKEARAIEGPHILPVSFARAIERAHGITGDSNE